jgi:hypothetical protein
LSGSRRRAYAVKDGREIRGITVEAFDKLKNMLAEIEEDLAKAEGGNKAAGVRVRKVMQDVKDAAQEIRVKILEMNKTEEKA